MQKEKADNEDNKQPAEQGNNSPFSLYPVQAYNCHYGGGCIGLMLLDINHWGQRLVQ